MKEKICSICNTMLPYLEFTKCKANKDGKQRRCKSCNSKVMTKYRKENEHTLHQYHTNRRNKGLNKEIQQKFHKANPGYSIKYYHSRINVDEEFAWNHKIRSMVHSLLNHKKPMKTIKLLGYDFNEFKSKIGLPNKGDEIDHKIPVSWFTPNTPIDLICSLDNLQIVTEQYNRRKGNNWMDKVSLPYLEQVKPHIKPEMVKLLKNS